MVVARLKVTGFFWTCEFLVFQGFSAETIVLGGGFGDIPDRFDRPTMRRARGERGDLCLHVAVHRHGIIVRIAWVDAYRHCWALHGANLRGGSRRQSGH